jgi:hypothetical protein
MDLLKTSKHLRVQNSVGLGSRKKESKVLAALSILHAYPAPTRYLYLRRQNVLHIKEFRHDSYRSFIKLKS